MDNVLDAIISRAQSIYSTKDAKSEELEKTRDVELNSLKHFGKELSEFFEDLGKLGFACSKPVEPILIETVQFNDSYEDLQDIPVDLIVLKRSYKGGLEPRKWSPLGFLWTLNIGNSEDSIWCVALTKSKYNGVVVYLYSVKDAEAWVFNEKNLPEYYYSTDSIKNIIVAKVEKQIAENGIKS